MRKSFFDLSVSLEEDTQAIVDDAIAAGGDEPVEAADVVEAEQETAELVENQQKAEDQVAALEDAEVIADDLEDQLEEQEKIIEEKPEEVTEDTVAVAQEAMFISLAKLGMKYEDIRAQRISLESGDSTPLQKFQVCTEGLKDTLVKVKDGIINAVQAIVAQIKKLWQNASIFFDRSASTADKLIAEYKGVSGNVQADDSVLNLLKKRFGGWYLVSGGIDFTSLLKFASSVQIPRYKPNESTTKIIETLKASVKNNGVKVTEELKKNINGTLPENSVPSYVIGAKLSVITDKDIQSFELKTDNIDNNKLRSEAQALNVAKLLVYVKTAKKYANEMKKYQNDAFGALDSIIKGIKSININEENENSDKGKDLKEQLALTRKIGTKFALESVNQYIATVNGTIACCAAMLKAVKKSDESTKKEDK